MELGNDLDFRGKEKTVKTLISGLIIVFALAFAQAADSARFDSSKYLYAAPVILDNAASVRLTITNMAFRDEYGNSLTPFAQTMKIAFMYNDRGVLKILAGDLTIAAGATVSFELGEFFGALPPGSLLIQSEEPIVGAIGSQAFELVYWPNGNANESRL